MHTRITRLHIIVASLFLFVATTMTFVNAVNADFVNWDDDAYVTDNPHIQKINFENVERIVSHTYFYSWIPVTLFSHAIDVALWGMNPRGHHLTNVLLHAFNAVWFFLVGILLFASSRSVEEQPDSSSTAFRFTASMVVGSFIAAGLYAMHPLRVESVAWVSGRKDLLCAFFLLPAFGSHLLWRRKKKKPLIVAAHLFFALAILSKPIAATFPVILILVDVWWMREPSERTHLLRRIVEGKTLLFLMSAGAALVGFLGAAGGGVNVVGELSLVERFLLPIYAIIFYLWKIIVPLDLSPVYPDFDPVMLYGAPIVAVGIIYMCFVLIEKKQTGVALAFFGYIIMLLPTFLGLSTGMQPLADRYTYLSTISIFMLVGGSAEWLWEKTAVSLGRFYQRELIFAVLLVLCGIYAYRTIRHLAIWNNSVMLWSQAVRYAPMNKGEFESRKPYMKPSHLDAYVNLGVAYYSAGNKDKAIEQFDNALQLDDHNADAHYNLGNLMFEKGDVGASMMRFKNAVACDSTYAKAYYNMGIVYAKQDSADAAIYSFRKAARLGYVDAQRVLGERGLTW